MNPWAALGDRAPFVLPSDAPAIDMFNQFRGFDRSLDRHASHVIELDEPPEPVLGPSIAPVVVLLLNPGIGPDKQSLEKRAAQNAALLTEVRRAGASDRHFWIERNHPWWMRLVRPIFCAPDSQTPDVDNAYAATQVQSIEFCAYRSISFGCGHLRLPSQEFAFDAARAAIARNAAIVVVRGLPYWFGAVPELANYARCYHLKNPRMASLSARNMDDRQHQDLRQLVARAAP